MNEKKEKEGISETGEEKKEEKDKTSETKGTLKEIFVFILKILGGLVVGSVYAVLGAILAALVIVLIVVIGALLTIIYGILLSFLGIVVILAVLFYVGGGFILGFLTVNKEIKEYIKKKIDQFY